MKGKKSFYLSKRKKYYIYGYTKRAVLVAELLQREKYNFCGYIDKDAERLKKEYQIEVRTIDNNEIEILSLDEDYVLFLEKYRGPIVKNAYVISGMNLGMLKVTGEEV